MKVMVIGSGGREHALAWKLAQSPMVAKLYVAPGNAGTLEVAENVDITATDLKGLVRFAKETRIDLTIVGPDNPLALGVVDLFTGNGLKIFGPTQAAAQIETSKVFAKDMMRGYKIPTAEYRSFDSFDAAKAYAQTIRYPGFIKASGLAKGKGAIECVNVAEAVQTLTAMMIEQEFGEAGETVVIEAFLDGPEISLHALTDGTDYLMLPSSQDNKPVFDGAKGPNTGGMGTVAPLPWVGQDEADELGKLVVAPLLKGMAQQGMPFGGLIYPGLKLTGSGPKVIEYNARFGDPETQVYMRLLQSDLLPLLLACIDGGLAKLKPAWRSDTYAVCVALASGGYPGSYSTGHPITGLDAVAQLKDVVVFQAGTKIVDGRVVTNGGRVLYVSATGSSVEGARRKAYAAVELIKFKGMHYRRDIGAKVE